LALRAYFDCPLKAQLELIDSEGKFTEVNSNINEGNYTLKVKEVTENLTETISVKKKSIHFNLTGFGEFVGVKDNPTSTLMRQLTKLLKNETKEESLNLPSHIKIENLTILETAGKASAQTFYSLNFSPTEKNSRCVWLHFGVATPYKSFALESQAFNEADFRVPDQQGWSPRGEQIISGVKRILETPLPLRELFQSIRLYGAPVTISPDPGRFVCNWIYFHSLHRSHSENTSSLFVHVPPYQTISYERQLEFAIRLICLVAELLQ